MFGNGKNQLLIVGLAIFSFISCAAIRPNPSTKIRSERRISAAEEQLRTDITLFSQNYLGIRYKYAGRKPDTGFDCSGFTSYIMSIFEIKVSPSSVEQSKQGTAIKLDEVQPGDLIFFRRKKAGRISHVAMVVSNDKDGLRIIHSTSRGVVIDNLNKSKYWKPKISHARDVITANLK